MRDESIGAFGDWLRGERLARGWSQLDLARESGVSQPQISNLEAGKSVSPQATTRERLQRALGARVPEAILDREAREESIEGLGTLQSFDPHDAALLPEHSGVYVLYDVSDRPVYVGKAPRRSIRARVQEHYEKFWFKYPIVSYGACVEIRDERLCGQVEEILIRFLRRNAVLNKQFVDR